MLCSEKYSVDIGWIFFFYFGVDSEWKRGGGGGAGTQGWCRVSRFIQTLSLSLLKHVPITSTTTADTININHIIIYHIHCIVSCRFCGTSLQWLLLTSADLWWPLRFAHTVSTALKLLQLWLGSSVLWFSTRLAAGQYWSTSLYLILIIYFTSQNAILFANIYLWLLLDCRRLSQTVWGGGPSWRVDAVLSSILNADDASID